MTPTIRRTTSHPRPHIRRDHTQRSLQQPTAAQPTQRLRDRQQRQLLGQRQATPRTETMPPAAARRMPSPANRVLPTPTSPATSAIRVSPPSAACRRDHSRSPPTNPADPAIHPAQQPAPAWSSPWTRVLETLLYLRHKTSLWLEITSLLIPGLNDSDADLDAMTQLGGRAARAGRANPLHPTAVR